MTIPELPAPPGGHKTAGNNVIDNEGIDIVTRWYNINFSWLINQSTAAHVIMLLFTLTVN